MADETLNGINAFAALQKIQGPSERRQVITERNRKNAAYGALQKTYGDIAGDPEGARQLQTYAQGEEAFPLLQQGREQAIATSKQNMETSAATEAEKQRVTRGNELLSGALFIQNARKRDPNADVGQLFDRIAPTLNLDPQAAASARATLVADPGAVDDLVTAFRLKQGAEKGDPAAVQEWNNFLARPPEQQKRILELKRSNSNPEVAGSIAGAQANARQQAALDYAAPIASAKAENTAVGKATGEAAAQSIHGAQDIAQAQAQANTNRLRFEATKANLDQALDFSDKAGVLATASQFIPNSAGSNLVAALNSVHSDIVNNVIQNFKDSTPKNQASGVGRIMASEIKLWQDSYAAVSLRQSPSVRKENIKRLMAVTEALKTTSEEFSKSVYGVEATQSLNPGDKTSAPATTSQGSAASKFQEGQTYQDASGNKARYEGGKFVPVQ